MPRADLLALTPEDLAILTNRGTVKRAQKEVEAGEPQCEIEGTEGGDLVVRWSDGITCRFAADKTIHDAICSSGGTGISRHVIRSVLAYQRANVPLAAPAQAEVPSAVVTESPSAAPSPAAAVSGEDSPGESNYPLNVPPSAPAAAQSPLVVSSWDPGAISDDELIAVFRKTTVTQARKRFAEGVLVELTRGSKPVARFLDQGCTVRFAVPGDLRYASADCSEALLPLWVSLAVWSFRQLPLDCPAGLLSLQQVALPVPRGPLENLQQLLSELCREGLGGIADSWPQRLNRVEQSLRQEGLVWPAELVIDLLHQHELYRQHDARFEPQQVPHVVGELVARSRAIIHDTRAVPQLLIRGTKADRPVEISSSRMVGVGLGIKATRQHTTISAYLQETDAGNVLAVERTFANPAPDSADRPRSFADLAATVLGRNISLALLGSSQLLIKSGKRTPGGQLILPRSISSITTHPQSYQWEQLKPPFAAETFRQLVARFETLPPSYLRPRCCTENLHVIAVEGAEACEFDVSQQMLTARLRDAEGRFATLCHPFHSRGREGFDSLNTVLNQRGAQVRFVCGHVKVRGRDLEIRPVSLILQDESRRQAIFPWVPGDSGPATVESTPDESRQALDNPGESPLTEFWRRLDHELAEVVLSGAAQTSAGPWEELTSVARQLGFARLTVPLESLAGCFRNRLNDLNWDPRAASAIVMELCLLSRLAKDVQQG